MNELNELRLDKIKTEANRIMGYIAYIKKSGRMDKFLDLKISLEIALETAKKIMEDVGIDE